MELPTAAAWSFPTIAIATLLTIALLRFLTNRLPPSVSLPPGSLGWPFLGHSPEFFRCFRSSSPDLFLARRIRRYGDCGAFTTHLFGKPTILTYSGEFNRFVFSNDAKAFGVGWPTLSLIGENAVPTLPYDDHYKRFKPVLFDLQNRPEPLLKFVSSSEQAFSRAFREWSQKGEVHVFDAIGRVAFHNMCYMFIGIQPGPLADEIWTQFSAVLKGIRAFPLAIPGTQFYNAIQNRKKVHATLQELVSMRRSNPSHYEKLQDVMSIMVRTVDERLGRNFTDAEIVDNIVGNFVAGYHPIAYILSWTTILLTRNPEALQKLQEEHRHIRAKKKDDEPLTLEDVRAMKYTEQVFDETQRLVNISPTLYRRILEDVDFKGIRFPKGWRVLMYIRAPNLDPANFDDPFVFNPDRWETYKAKPGVFTPFGLGVRRCVGVNMAKYCLAVYLHHLVLNYRWELVGSNSQICYLPHPMPQDKGLIRIAPLKKVNGMGVQEIS